MIALIKRYSGKQMTYEFTKGNDICYVGKILTQTQINFLRKFGNTCVNEELLANLGKEQLIKEIQDLTGLNVRLETSETEWDGTTVIVKAYGTFPVELVPDVTIYRRKHKDYYIVYRGKKEFCRFSKKHTTLEEIKDILKMNGVHDFEIK